MDTSFKFDKETDTFTVSEENFQIFELTGFNFEVFKHTYETVVTEFSEGILVDTEGKLYMLFDQPEATEEDFKVFFKERFNIAL